MRFLAPALAAGLIALSLQPFPAGAEEGEAPSPKIRIKEPTFPLEPNKKPVQPVNAASYVQAPTEPPVSEAERESVIPKVGRGEDEWMSSLELGWFYDNLSAEHSFTWTGGSGPVKRENASPLSLMGRLKARPPHSFLSGELRVSGTTGRAEAGGTGSAFVPQRFTVEDVETAAGPRAHLLRRSSAHDLAIGADIGYALASYTTLTPDFLSLDVDNRQLIQVIERLQYRYVPNANWSLSLELGYGQMLSSSGAGNVAASGYRSIESEGDALRYLSEGNAIGLGLFYGNEKTSWSQTSPVTIADSVVTQDFRINLFWRREF